MRFGFIGFGPLHLVPLFILFPFTHFFSLLFFHVFPCFMSCHLISFLLLRAHRLALSLYMRNLLSSQVSGRPGFCNEVGCHRLFLRTWFIFIATTHTLVPSCPLHVFILLSYCAHTHTFALTLVLLASPNFVSSPSLTQPSGAELKTCLPSGRRVCVCVCPL